MEALTLTVLLEQCERDTATHLGKAASYRLGRWREHVISEGDLVVYVSRLLRGDHRINGYALDQKGGMSLEKIVLDVRPDLFDDADKREAAKTLGREG